ncbi:MAG TPA: alpha/beta hydrolase [Dongiaceae bacterium]|jgi:pimeloyl-ACP methyl ester carboxylesterase|nr:alpha/beta hydrolase [Dongiaceae bacterium]
MIEATHPRHAVIVGPVMPVWDEGRFARTLSDWLIARGYSVSAVDSMTYSKHEDLKCAVAAFEEDLYSLVPPVSLLVGYAFGGALVVRAAENLPEYVRVIGLSSPTMVSQSLRENLGKMCAALDEGDLLRSLELHERYATNTPHVPGALGAIDRSDYPKICDRMARSFRLLMSQSEHPEDGGKRPPILFILGEKSELVRREHLSVRGHDRLAVLPGAGMRVLSDAPRATLACIETYLSE